MALILFCSLLIQSLSQVCQSDDTCHNDLLDGPCCRLSEDAGQGYPDFSAFLSFLTGDAVYLNCNDLHDQVDVPTFFSMDAPLSRPPPLEDWELEDLMAGEKPPLYIPTATTWEFTKIALGEKLPVFNINPLPDPKKELERYVFLQDPVMKKIRVPKANKTFAADKQATIDFFLNGMGITRVQPKGDHACFASFQEMPRGPPKPGTLKYGGEIHFEQTPAGPRISKLVVDGAEVKETNEVAYRRALMRLRSTAFHYVTMVDHLSITHLVYSNYLVQAVAVIDEKKDPYKLSQLLLPHIFGALEKNSAGFNNLINEDGVMKHATNGEWEDLIDIIKQGRKDWEWRYFPDWFASVRSNELIGNSPFFLRGIHVYNAIERHVDRYLDRFQKPGTDREQELRTIYPESWAKLVEQAGVTNLSKISFEKSLVQSIWVASYYHFHAGGALQWLYDPDNIRWDLSGLTDADPVPSSRLLWSLAVGLSVSQRQKSLLMMKNPFGFNEFTLWNQFIHELQNFEDPENNYDWLWELEPSVAR